jgi:hypothetical protein
MKIRCMIHASDHFSHDCKLMNICITACMHAIEKGSDIHVIDQQFPQYDGSMKDPEGSN